MFNKEILADRLFSLFLKTKYSHHVSLEDINKHVDNIIENKKRLNKILGLNEENNYRLVIKIQDAVLSNKLRDLERLLNPFCYYYLKIADFSDIRYDWENNKLYAGKQVIKISKLINKIIKAGSNNDIDIRNFISCLKDICDYLKILVPEENGDFNIARFFELITSSKNYLYLSSNPYDFYTASHHASFSSCFRPDGEYCATINSFAQDDFTLCAFIAQDGINKHLKIYKIGRCWVHINTDQNNNLKSIAFNNHYGTYSRQANESLIKEIESKFGVTTDPETRNNLLLTDMDIVEVVEEVSSIYVDDTHENYIYIEPEEDAIMYVHPPRCVKCGSHYTIFGRSWLCEECCHVAKCAQCGAIIHLDTDDDFSEVNGDIICADCLDKNFVRCISCGGYYDPGDLTSVCSIRNTNDYICYSCLSLTDKFATCENCGSLDYTNNMYEIYKDEDSQSFLVCRFCFSNKFRNYSVRRV